MKKLLFAVLMISLFTACERVESNGSFEKQQKNEHLKKPTDTAKADGNHQNSESSDLDTTDPKDIIVPPRH